MSAPETILKGVVIAVSDHAPMAIEELIIDSVELEEAREDGQTDEEVTEYLVKEYLNELSQHFYRPIFKQDGDLEKLTYAINKLKRY